MGRRTTCELPWEPKPVRPGIVSAHEAPRPPPHVYFVVSAIFHYLGPAFAVLLFARVDVLGVAWLRIASAALVFAALAPPLAHAGRRSTGPAAR